MAQDLRVDGMVYQQFLNLTGDIPTGWHTIAIVEGRSGGAAGTGTGDSDQRAIGNFMIRNTDSSRHQSVTLTASHLFGAANGNGISIDHASYFSTIGIDGFRLKENATYDGAVLQISIANATNDIEVWLSNNYQYDGWTLIQPVPDAVDPSTPTLGLGYDNAYSTFSAAATNMLTNIAGNGQSVQGTLEVKNDLLVTNTIRQGDVTNAVLVANGSGDLVAASNLTDTAYSTTDTTDANVDTYGPLNLMHWNMTPPTSTADALDRIAAWIAAVGPTLTPPGPPL